MKSPFFPTEIYSLGYWLKDYVYYPQKLPAFVFMDHGNNISDKVFPDELETYAPIVFKFAPRLLTAFKEASDKPAYGMLNPTIHCRNVRGYKQKPDAKGTLFYVGHSTDLVEDLTDWNEFIDSFQQIPQEFLPIDICLHPTDIKKGLDKVFIERGYKIYTAGDQWSKAYADNMYGIMTNYKYTMSNLPGSYHAYSVELGIPFSLYGEEPKYFNKGDINLAKGTYDSYKDYKTYRYVVGLFTGFHTKITDEQKEFVNYNVGKTHTISRTKTSLLLYKALIMHVFKYPGVIKQMIRRA